MWFGKIANASISMDGKWRGLFSGLALGVRQLQLGFPEPRLATMHRQLRRQLGRLAADSGRPWGKKAGVRRGFARRRMRE